MNNQPTLQETIQWAKQLHSGQKDFGGKDYILHLLAVLNLLPDDAPEYAKISAILHDAPEDVKITDDYGNKRSMIPDDFYKKGYSSDTVNIIFALKREPFDHKKYLGLTREQTNIQLDLEYLNEYIPTIAQSKNLWLMEIKRADNLHNSDPDRNEHLTEQQLAKKQPVINRLTKRYQASIKVLEPEIANLREELGLTNSHENNQTKLF